MPPQRTIFPERMARLLISVVLSLAAAISAMAADPRLVIDLHDQSPAPSSSARRFEKDGSGFLFVAESRDGVLWKTDGTKAEPLISTGSAVDSRIGELRPWGVIHAIGTDEWRVWAIEPEAARVVFTTHAAQHVTTPHHLTIWRGRRIFFVRRHSFLKVETDLYEMTAAGDAKWLATLPLDVVAVEGGGEALLIVGQTDRTAVLWRFADGRATEVVTLCASSSSGFYPRDAFRFGETVVFSICMGLFRTDGTAAGTTMISALLWPSADGATLPSGVVISGETEGQGREPWFTDGTAAGTYILRDFVPGSRTSRPRDFRRIGDRVAFVAEDVFGREHIHVTDGTSANTTLLTDFPDATVLAWVSTGERTAALLQTAFEVALWEQRDGVARRITTVSPPHAWRPLDEQARPGMIYVGDTLYFSGFDAVHGWEVWRSGGTPESTTLAFDLRAENLSGDVANLTDAGDRLYFTTPPPKYHSNTDWLWQTEGERATTRRLDEGLSSARDLLICDQNLVYGRCEPAGECSLVAVGPDGTRTRIADPVAGPAFGAPPDGGCLGTTYFAQTRFGPGMIVAVDLSNGTRRSLLSDVRSVGAFRAAGSRIFFVAQERTKPAALYASDGTPERTRAVLELGTSSGRPLSPSEPAMFRGDTYLLLYGEETAQLIAVDSAGNASPVGPPVAINGAPPLGPAQFRVVGDRLLYWIEGREGPELWALEGREAAPARVAAVDRQGSALAVLGNAIYFFVWKREITLWKSDGTTEGTVEIPWDGDMSPWPDEIVAFEDRLYFAGTLGDGVNPGIELHSSDGTPGGLRHERELNPVDSSFPRELTVSGGKLYFTASTLLGRELWVIDDADAPPRRRLATR